MSKDTKDDSKTAGNEDDGDAVIASKTAPLSLDILSIVTTSQLENGLRHGDYLRYRRYCSKKLKRLRKSLGFTHGKGKLYQERHVTPEDAIEDRFLLIPLVNAERAWAYAMEKKSDEDLSTRQDTDDEDRRKRHYMLRRLRKAIMWSKKLEDLCAKRGDARTAREATAYAAYISGVMQVETMEWIRGISSYLTVMNTYAAILAEGETKYRELFQERLHKAQKAAEYCRHMAKRLNVSIPDDLESKFEGGSGGRAQKKDEEDERAIEAEALRDVAMTMISDAKAEINADAALERPLIERLDLVASSAQYAASASDSSAPFHVAPLVPSRYLPIACKPCLFDIAFTNVRRPNLMHRLNEEKRKEAEARRQSMLESDEDDDFDSADDEEEDDVTKDPEPDNSQSGSWLGGWFG